MPTRQRKRPRKDSDNNRDRPAAPPPAPPSLVKLLKKDKKVLEYFRSLQENLSYDVEKWKKRSHAYKEELEELKLVQETTRRIPTAAPTESGKNNQKHNNTKEKSKSSKVNVTVNRSSNKEAHIDDSAFDFELSSSEDEDDEDKERKPQHSVATRRVSTSGTTKSYKFNIDDEEEEEDDDHNHDEEVETLVKTKSGRPSKNKLVPNHIRVGWKYLRKAEEYLNEIGIILATSIVIDEIDDNINDDSDNNGIATSNDNGKNEADAENDTSTKDNNIAANTANTTIEDSENEAKPHSHTSYIRRNDTAVLGDIVETIKEWTKLKITVDFPLRGSDISNEMNKDGGNDSTSNVSTNAENVFKHRYAAFESRERIPCFVPLPSHLLGGGKLQDTEDENNDQEPSTAPQHPAVWGIEILVKALAWIDAFGSILDEIEIDYNGQNKGSENDARHEDDTVGSYFTQLVESENDSTNADPSSNAWEKSFSSAALFVMGMKKRYVMVRKFVKSLEGEICDTWPMQDRFDRHRNISLHDDRNQSNITPENITNDILEETRLVLDSKNSSRLATMAERCIFARIVTSTHLHRGDPSSAIDFLFRYILVTTPSIELESYPKHPPVQSFLMIEAILNTIFPCHTNENADSPGTLFDYLLHNQLKSGSHPLFEVFELALATSAFIYRIRMSHEDTRISEPGFVEEAAYRRIVSCFKRNGIGPLDSKATTDPNNGPDSLLRSYSQNCTKLIQLFVQDFAQPNGKTAFLSKMFTWMIPIASTLQGNGQKVRNLFLERSEMYLATKSVTQLMILEGLSKALRQIEIRSIDSYRAVINSSTTTEMRTSVQSAIAKFVDLVTTKEKNGYENEDVIELSSLSILVRICHELADGESALRLAEWWSKCNITAGIDAHSILEDKEKSVFFKYGSAFPMVRVINLERREDRMAAFMGQAMHAGLWAIRGVVPPDRWTAISKTQASDQIFTPYNGTFAIDGSQGSPAEVETKLMDWIELGGYTNGSAKRELDSLVKPQWRPNDLRAFDIHASDDPTLLVSLSPSEKACALSHIATWKGISSHSFGNSFTYTGFARGDPMHESMGRIRVDHMPPCPVALVLEDDAVLVDRFQERLDQILEELPRDFHYCALGYARPKEAPLLDIPGCEHIKLPTMTWYLTGYLLSQSGAQYLLDHLPVIGPVDAWMGGKMILTSNWENEFGHRVGVGDAPQKGVDYVRPTLSLKEMKMCIKFRAYCAGVPLCDQKVRTTTATGASANRQEKPIQNWRLRDSDITYSGHVGVANRKRKSHR